LHAFVSTNPSRCEQSLQIDSYAPNGCTEEKDIAANIRDFWSRAFAWFDRWSDIARDDRGKMLFDGERGLEAWGARACSRGLLVTGVRRLVHRG
jgi:hypothetical protein